LVDRSLGVLDDADRPFLTRAIRVPDRVAAHLLGDDAVDPTLLGIVTDPVPFPGERSGQLARALQVGQSLVYVRESGAGIGPSVAAAALQAAGRPVLGVELSRLALGRDPRETVTVLGREALLRGAGVVAGPVEALTDHPEALRMLDREGAVAAGRGHADPDRPDRVVVHPAGRPVRGGSRPGVARPGLDPGPFRSRPEPGGPRGRRGRGLGRVGRGCADRR
jgi:hypothetical protein